MEDLGEMIWVFEAASPGDLLDGVHGAVLLLVRARSCLGWSPRPPAVAMPGITEDAGQLGVERLLHATRVGRLLFRYWAADRPDGEAAGSLLAVALHAPGVPDAAAGAVQPGQPTVA